ncbi:MAG: hypothetical protein ABI882_22210, partial [Acidobacteriota bacterium]
MTAPNEVVFLLDVDNALLDNDQIEADLRDHLEREFGPESRDRYWTIFETLRAKLGYADDLGALQRYRFSDTTLEWRRMVAETWVTFLLVLVAVGGGVVRSLGGGSVSLAMKRGCAGAQGDGDYSLHGYSEWRSIESRGHAGPCGQSNFPWRR